MYGFIYNTLRGLVVDNYGEETWQQICAKAGVEITNGVLNTHYYDEAVLGKVGATAAEILGIPQEQILESFGGYFFETIKKSGHSSMLRTLGHNLHGFLMNLDSLHDHLSVTYTEMQAPSFRCEKTGRGLILHYYSVREGLHTIVTGIVKAVALEYFRLDVDIKVEKYELTQERLPHHYVLRIDVKDAKRYDLERLTGESTTSLPSVDVLPTVESEVELQIEAPTLFFVQAPPPACPESNRSKSTGQVISIDSCDEEEVDHICPILSPDVEDYDALKEHLAQMGFQKRGSLQGSLHARLPYPLLPSLPSSQTVSRRGSYFVTELDNWPVTPHLFQNTFPFHVIFDKDLVIRHMGVSLSRLFPRAIANEAKLGNFFDLSRPSVQLTYQNIRSSIHNVFILQTKKSTTAHKNNAPKKALQFRGQMVPTSGRDGAPILFLGSPRISSIEELELQGLYLSDIPIHDVTRDLILLNKHFQVEVSIARELEETKQELLREKARVVDEKARADNLLHAMLPQSIAAELKHGVDVSATEHPAVTILFSDIKGFTLICKDCQPMEVVGMLNQLYTLFDSLIEKHKVYKVETIGDAYMVAAGLLETSKNPAEAVTDMAFDMREEAGKVTKPTSDDALQIRIGIHTGAVVAGVVGKKMPRYCLFGDTVNTAARMESHGEPGYVHISVSTYSMLKGKPYVFYSRGKIRVKGLGLRQTYFVEPASDHDGTTHIMVQPEDSDSDGVGTGLDPKLRSPSFIRFQQLTVVKPSTPSLLHMNSNPFQSSGWSPEGRSTSPLDMVKPQRNESVLSVPDPSSPIFKVGSGQLQPDPRSTSPSVNGRVSGVSNNSSLFIVHRSSREDLSQPEVAQSWTTQSTPRRAGEEVDTGRRAGEEVDTGRRAEEEVDTGKHSKRKQSKRHRRKCRIS